ncbi:TlpA disulfide reductase family protein [Dyella psychrodurans]|nr:TlpA disulfide reductase family protein [Dyella psychrodurans]
MIVLIMAACAAPFLSFHHAHRVQAWHRLAITGLDGKPLSPLAWNGRFVLINFWSTDCEACLAEMPALENAYMRYGASGLSVVGVALSNDDPNRVAAAAAMSHVTYPQAWDASGQLNEAFGGIAVVPTTLLVDNDGDIVFRQEGALNESELASLAEAYGLCATGKSSSINP